MKRLLIAIILMSVLMPIMATSSAVAQTPQSLVVEGLGIDPFLLEIDTEPGATVTRKIKLTNTTNEALSFLASINDFIPNGHTGQPLFLGTNENADPHYSLSSWVTITKQPNFTIPALGETEVEFTISPPVDADPGTHYGGILFGRPPGTPIDSSSAVQHKAGAIILVKLGRSQEQVELADFSVTNNIWEQGPIDFTTVLANTGNTHSKPKGEITITNIVGGRITQIPINRDANIVLPQSTRDFASQWLPRFAFGRYTAEAVVYYGNPKLELHSKVTFWIVPVKELVLGVLLLLILGIIVYIGIRRYNRYIIKHSEDEN